MESAIATFCKTLATFCNNIESSTRDLSDSIQRRPIPLDSAASAFLQSLDRRISSVSTDLNVVDSMAFGTVSFEELLGHCNEVYKTNQKYIDDVEDRIKSFGYVPELELEDGDRDGLGLDSEFSSPKIEAKVLDFTCGSVSAVKSNRKKLEEDLLFDDSLSLQNLGLSDACLATLASDNDYPACPILSSQDAISQEDSQLPNSAASFQLPIVLPIESGTAKTNAMIKISEDDYDTLPSYMKSLASWEELQGAVVKLNDYVSKKEGAEECSAINQLELESLALGHKGRSYLLLLLRMKQLVVENVAGSIQYRACASES